jgi:hypothetical protein
VSFADLGLFLRGLGGSGRTRLARIVSPGCRHVRLAGLRSVSQGRQLTLETVILEAQLFHLPFQELLAEGLAPGVR